jgi:hypothetical protein
MDETTIILKPCESGYQVYIGDRRVGTLMERIWGEVSNGVLAAPCDINTASQRFPTLGLALDYLLSVDKKADVV